MRADRLLSILLLMQVRRRVTAQELARRLEVSERTIYRDMEALSAAGVPVAAERGLGGGWFLLEAYKTSLTGLNLNEVQALFLTNPPRLLADLGLAQAAEAALIKLLAALPAMQRRDAEYIRQRIHLDISGWRHSEAEDISFLPALQQALGQECRVELTYRRSDETIVERVIDPLGLVAKGMVWYLVAGVEEELRIYRVSRIQAARATNQACLRPPGFDLAGYWEQASAQFKAALPRYPATVRVHPALLSRLHYAWRYAPFEQTEPPDAAGWLKLAVQFETEQEACENILSLGPQIEVLEPAALREKVINQAEQIIAFYTKNDPANS